MLNTMMENESNSFTNNFISFLRSCSQHILWTWSQERDRNTSKFIIFIFHHSMQHDEASVHFFYNSIACPKYYVEKRNFSLNWQFWVFEPNLAKEAIFALNYKNSTPLWNSAYTKFQIKLIKLILTTKVDKKRFWIEFCVFELVLVLNFNFNKKCEHFRTNLSQKG